MKKSRKKRRHKHIAKQRLQRLYTLIQGWENAGKREFAQNAADHAGRISKRTNTPLPRGLRRRICRKCGSLLTPGRNLLVRCDKKYRRVVYTCRGCGRKAYYPYVRKTPP
ncbi:MAG: ribonuclease P [Candidatus Altiarchaeales archaeon]|nr:ribonuclease P [Candidatus Altiarchaeales archaeon]